MDTSIFLSNPYRKRLELLIAMRGFPFCRVLALIQHIIQVCWIAYLSTTR